MTTLQKPNVAQQGPLQVGQIFIWQYEIQQLIGSGGHAFVYRARHRFLGHMVAIKVLHRAAGVSLEMLRRGQAEAQIEFQLKHPGIVSVLDAGLDNDGLLYIVMELLQGRSMRDALIELGKFNVIEVLRFGAKVALAIDVAHRAGVVHRDLKPENIFFTRNNEPKVIDFGIAKIDDAAGWQTQKDMILGTAYYLSPEQVMGLPVTPRSDIYSLGTIMLEALLGEPAVLRQVAGRPLTFKLLTRIIGTEQLPPLNQLDRHIPAYVDRLLAKATAKRPEERFATMLEFAEAIEACARALESDLVKQGASLGERELWRKARSASGVETVGTSTTPFPEHDTAPASRPPFFGGLSSSTATVVPRSAAAGPPVGEPNTTATPARPTVFQDRDEPKNTTAPLGSPRSSQKPAVVVPITSAIGQAIQSSPPTSAVSVDADEPPEIDEHERRASPVIVLLWGLAVGIVVFGAGALLILRPKGSRLPAAQAAIPAPTAHSTQRSVDAPLPLPAERVAPPPAPDVTTPVQASAVREPLKPLPQRLPARVAPKEEAQSAPPSHDGRSTIF